ncbi:MAG: ATP synthase F0 subunit B [Deltaproteobacteria bacterium]|nr:ATP synthase F0 subunit B [Deltaproteobacteria bacterium]
MLDINLTVLWQIIGFLVLMPILSRFLFTPAIKALKERDEKIGGNLRKAQEYDRVIADGLAAYEKRLKDAAIKGNEERAKRRLESVAREKEIIEAARGAASRELGVMKTALEKNKASAMVMLKAEAKALGSQMAEKILDRKVMGIVVLLACLSLPALGFAETEGGGHEEGGSGMLWKIVNFVILVIGIGCVWKYVIKGMLSKRGMDIEQAIKDAVEAKAAADRKYAEYQAKVAMLEASVVNVHNELRLEGEAESARLLAEASAAAQRIKDQARFTAEQEVKKARIELRREAAVLAASMAEEMLVAGLKGEDHDRLVKAYLKDLSAGGNKTEGIKSGIRK